MSETSDPPSPREGTLTDRAVDLALRGLIGAALAMPYDRRVPFFGAAARRVAGPLAGYRRRALANLALIHPDWPEARREAVAAEALDNFGRLLIEIYSWREFGPRLAGTQLTGEGWPHLEAARAAGRPVIFVSGHFGNFDVPRQVLMREGFQIGGFFREMNNPYVNRHYVENLKGPGGLPFPKSRRGLRDFIRHIGRGGMATILFDLHDGGGVPISFLGRPAMTATTAADLALRFDAALMPYWGIRRPDGLTFDAVLEAPIPHSTPLAMMEEATRRLEAQVAAHPGQWFWIHRRWKGAPA
ncbi:lysophospholipid acyltransferase family protein [Rubellimicrobium roseum]|uniref:Lauroyl acyltransferase n=1 Tax=Rubellimicrobium roseum TaxID=687525 RepID=A0A5C4NLZ8_9RHOB|nr:lysophospholipid acyltransferase family protein [Rubellimicrobium roseum]TNC73439.1 lauroyl acyltransferase [Rubellimicrobium roseum]